MQKTPKPNLNQEGYYENYYFVIKSPTKETTIRRATKQAALNAFQHYLSLGKELEWQGKWTGNAFQDTETPVC